MNPVMEPCSCGTAHYCTAEVEVITAERDAALQKRDNYEVLWRAAQDEQNDYIGRYETAHASRMWAQECFRRVEAERDAAQAYADRLQGQVDAVTAERDALAEELDRATELVPYGALRDRDYASTVLARVRAALQGGPE